MTRLCCSTCASSACSWPVLVVVNLFVPRRFHWREELARLSLLNRQIFQAHSIFLVLMLGAVLGAAADLRATRCSNRRA